MVCITAKSQILAPDCVFSGLANLMASLNFSSTNPCYYGNKNLGILTHK